MSIILQKDLKIVRSYKPENNGVYDYSLLAYDEPVHVQHSANSYDFAVVSLADLSTPRMQLYRYNESIPEADMLDRNTFIIPITLN